MSGFLHYLLGWLWWPASPPPEFTLGAWAHWGVTRLGWIAVWFVLAMIFKRGSSRTQPAEAEAESIRDPDKWWAEQDPHFQANFVEGLRRSPPESWDLIPKEARRLAGYGEED